MQPPVFGGVPATERPTEWPRAKRLVGLEAGWGGHPAKFGDVEAGAWERGKKG